MKIILEKELKMLTVNKYKSPGQKPNTHMLFLLGFHLHLILSNAAAYSLRTIITPESPK